MKTGKSIVELALEIERRAGAKRDLIVRSASLGMLANDSGNLLSCPTQQGRIEMPINDVAHEQIASYVKIPRDYYERCRREAPALLATNVNNWIGLQTSEARMVRVLDGRARALLSDKFSRDMENEDLAQPLFEAIEKIGAEVVSCEITDVRFYVKAVDRKVNREIAERFGSKIGQAGAHGIYKDILCPAIVVSNSEVGKGSLSVKRSFLKEGCTNLAVFKEGSVRKTHVGSRHVSEEFAVELSERTRALKGAALIAELRDVIHNCFDEKIFSKSVERLQLLGEEKIVGNVPEVIEVTRKYFGMTEVEANLVQRHLIEGADLSRWGLLNAITRAAEDLPSYDRASEFERFGGDVIELPANQWKQIAEAA